MTATNEGPPLTNGEKHNDLPLARRPSGAIQKVAPGANRILSGMAADALTLVPARQPDKAVCIVLTGDDVDGTVPLFLFKVLSETEGFERFNFRHVCFKRASDLPTIAATEPFDLIVINFTRVMWDIGNEDSLGSRSHKKTADAFDDIVRFLAALKSKHHNKPIIIFSTLEDTRLSASRFAEVGVNYFLMPHSLAECKTVFSAFNYLNANLHTTGMWSKASPHRKTHLLRIVVVENDDHWLEMMREIIPKCFNRAEVITTTSPGRALSILEECAPDLLITADVMPRMRGKELVRTLIAKNVNYPILVHIGSAPIHQWVNEYVSQGYNIGFLAMEHLKDGSNGIKRRIKEMLIRQNITKQSEDKTKIFNGQKPKPTFMPVAQTNDENAEDCLDFPETSPASVVEWLQQGKNFYFGCGVSKSYRKAFTLFLKAATTGHPEAQFHVGLCFEDGDGVMPDQVQAAEWYLKSAIGGYAKAQNNLAICYRDGEGVPEDYFEAEKWYSMAAMQGYAPASCRPKNESRGHGLTCEQLSSSKNPGAVKNMYFYYRYKFGHGAPQEGTEAVKWYRIEAEQGLPEAQTNLGVCYELGHGVPQDIIKAAKWYRMAADQYYTGALNKLVVGIQSGLIIPIDADEEWKWYLMEEKSMLPKLCRQGAKRGEASKQISLGICYEKGIGIPQDLPEAYKWFKLVTGQGGKNGVERLTSVSSSMTSDQLQEGERRYSEFQLSNK